MNGDPRCGRCGGPLPRHYPPCRTVGPERLSGLRLLSVIFGGLALVVLVAAIVTGCHFKVGPFVDGDSFCDGADGGPVGDLACPDGTHCAFPAPGWRARCMPGDVGVDTPPDWARRRVDAGGP